MTRTLYITNIAEVVVGGYIVAQIGPGYLLAYLILVVPGVVYYCDKMTS